MSGKAKNMSLISALRVHKDNLTGFWVVERIETHRKDWLDNKEKALVMVMIIAGYQEKTSIFEFCLTLLRDAYVGSDNFVVTPREFDRVVKPGVTKFTERTPMPQESQQPCIHCTHLAIDKRIRCEHCGQRYCPMCAVDPEFYQGNDCPWCAAQSDNRMKVQPGNQNARAG